MKKYVWLFGIFTGFVLVAVIALLLSPYPRDALVRSIERASGLDIEIKGPFSLRFFPSVGVRAEDVTLSNRAVQGSPVILAVRLVEARANLWSLIWGARSIESVQLVDPRVVLAVDASGKPNWEVPGAEPGAVAAGAVNNGFRVVELSIAGGQISYRDDRAKMALRFESVDGSASQIDVVGLQAGALELRGARLALRDDGSKRDIVVEPAELTGRDVGEASIGRLMLAGAKATIIEDSGQRLVIDRVEASLLDFSHSASRAGEVGLKSSRATIDRAGGGTVTVSGLEANGSRLTASAIETLTVAAKQVELRRGPAQSSVLIDGVDARANGVRLTGTGSLSLTGRIVSVRDGEGAPLTAATGAALTATSSSIPDQKLDGVTFKSAGLGLGEVSRGATQAITAVEASTPVLGFGSPIDTALAFVFNKERVEGRLRLPPPEALVLSAQLPSSLTLTSRHGRASFEGEVAASGETRSDARFAKGRIDVAAPSLEALARWLDFPLPDGFAGTATASGDVEARIGRIALSNAMLTHVGQSAGGTLVIETTGARPRISGRLESDKLNADRYVGLPAPKRALTRSGAGAPAPAGGIPANQVIKAYFESLLAQPTTRGAGRLRTDAEFSLEAPTRTTTSKLSDLEWDTTPIKFAALNTFDLDLDLTVRALNLRGLEIGVPAMKANLSEGKLEIGGSDLVLRGGQLDATAVIDARQGTPSVAARVKGTGIDVSRVLEAFGFDPVLAGASSIEADVTSRGISERELVEGLSGRVQAKMGSGRIVGYDLTTPWGLAAAGSFDPRRSMDVNGGTAVMTIENGVTRDTKAELTGPKISADGSGVIRLVPQEMNYKANVKLGWLSSILVNVFGDWSSLKWRYSLGGILLGGSNGGTSPDLVPADIFGDPELARLADQVLTRAGQRGLDPGMERFVREVKAYASAPARAR